MKKRTYKRISHHIGNTIIPLLFAVHVLLRSVWTAWLMAAALCAITIFHAVNFKHTPQYLRLQGGEKWRRYKSLYHSQLFTQRIVAIMIIVVIAAVIVAIKLKY